MSELMYKLNMGQGFHGWVELTQHDGYVSFPVQGGGEDHAPCMWFPLCERDAVTTVAHPQLGAVPCCQSCADFASDK